MVDSLKVYKRSELSFREFLEENDYDVEQATDKVMKVERPEEIAVLIHQDNGHLYFEVDLGSIEGLTQQELLLALLDLNTEILPVSVGVDTTSHTDPRLVLVESREADNLDENELLSVLSALEIATDKVAKVLADYL